jgi:hypothetical protein
MGDDSTLRRKARQAIQGGKLPERFPDRTWGGPGAGDDCTICGASIESDELELEIEFAGSDGGLTRDRHHVHIRCFAAWEFELRQLKRGGKGAGNAPRPDSLVAAGPAAPGQGGDASARDGALPRPAGEGKINGRGSEQTYNRRGSG